MCYVNYLCLLTFLICFLFLFSSYLSYLLPSRSGPLRFQVGCRRKQLNVVFSLLRSFCVIIFLCSCSIVDRVVTDLVIMLTYILFFASLGFSLFFSVLVDRLGGKSVPEITYFVSSETLSINPISQSTTFETLSYKTLIDKIANLI